MDISIGTVTNKIIFAIIGVSLAFIVLGAVFFLAYPSANVSYAIPFATGILMSMLINILKTYMLKRAVVTLVEGAEKTSAKAFFQLQAFLRMGITLASLVIAFFLPDNIMSLWGAIIGIFSHSAAMYLLKFLLPKETEPEAEVITEGSK